jgi:hypothetical protein
MTLQEKHIAFAGWVSAQLGKLFRVSINVDPATIDGADTYTMRKVMGKPIRYAEVLYSNDVATLPAYKNVRGAPIRDSIQFEVNVWYERNNKNPAQTELEFRSIYREGLLVPLKQLRTLPTEKGVILVDTPTPVSYFDVQVSEDNILCHFASLNVVLI